MPLALGTRVLSHFGGGEQEFPGVISASYSDNTYGIDYDDGDTEDRVPRNLIRILKVERQQVNHVDDKEKAEALLQLEKAKEENRLLRREIANMSTLIADEELETENLMTTLNNSLTEARRAHTEKDEELRKASMEISTLKEKLRSQPKQPSLGSLTQQLEDMKKELIKAQEGEVAARRAHQQTKKEVKVSTDQLVQSLTDQIKDLREDHVAHVSELERQVEEAQHTAREAIEKWEQDKKKSKEENNGPSDSDVEIELLKRELSEATKNAEDWERRHKDMQVLSDQAYEIMKQEINQKDELLMDMHRKTARMERDAEAKPPQKDKEQLLAEQAIAFADRQDKRTAQEALREQQRLQAEVDKYKERLSLTEMEKASLLEENKMAIERVEKLTSELDQLRSQEKLPQSTGSVREEELAKEVKRWMRKYNELTDLSDDAYTILSNQLRERDEVAHELSHNLQRAEMQIKEYENMIERLQLDIEESHAAAEAAGRLAEKALHEKHAAHEEAVMQKERADRAEYHGTKIELPKGSPPTKKADSSMSSVEDEDEAKDTVAPLTNDVTTQPEVTNELAESIHKLKTRWNAGDSSQEEQEGSGPSSPKSKGESSGLFSNFQSPLTQKRHASLATSPDPVSPEALAAQAAKKHLHVLEKEVNEAKEREDTLREELIKARSLIRKLKEGEGLVGEEDGGLGDSRGFCGANFVSKDGKMGGPASGVVSYEVVKENVRRLSQTLMSGDAPPEVVAEYDKWEGLMAAHPDYLAERRQQLDAFLEKHADRNQAALEATRRFVPQDIWEISFQTFSAGAGNLPEKLIKHIWENKILWWVRLNPKCIARIHVADLRSKYLIQNLDLTEMRAVMAMLPDSFENDPNGEKEGWRANTLETIRSAFDNEEKGTLNKEKIRGRLYFNGGPLKGPYDPDGKLHEFEVTTSEAFAPTKQFQMVSRIDDNDELRNRRSSITGESESSSSSGQVKRQVEQFVDIRGFAENPEMQRRRDAFSKDRIMSERESDNAKRSITTGDVRGSGGLGSITSLFAPRDMSDFDVENSRPKTQWEQERENLQLIMSGRDERTAFDPNANRSNTTSSSSGYMEWEVDLAKAYQQKKAAGPTVSRADARRKNRQSTGSLLTATGTLTDSLGEKPSHRRGSSNSVVSSSSSRSSGSGSSQPWAAARRAVSSGDVKKLGGNDRMNDIVNKYKL